MAEKIQLDLVSPECLVLSTQVERVTIPGAEGDFGVLAKHSPFMSVIRPGILVVRDEAHETSYELEGGFADVRPDGVTILAEAIKEINPT